MKTIEILCGIPCSGKSTYANDYYNNNFVFSISRDDIRESYHFNSPYVYSKQNENKVTEIFNKYCNCKLNDKNFSIIILDNTHCKEKYIDEIIKQYSNHNIVIKYFDISLFKAHYRNIIRYFKTDKWIPIKVMNQMYKNYNKINKQKYEKYMVY